MYRRLFSCTESGATDRDETVGPNPVFLRLSNALSNGGYAVLRYDKRGVGKSGGNGAATTRDELLADVEAAFAFTQTLHNVDPRRIFLLGHSEGGELAPTVAANRRDIAGIILMAPPALPLAQIITQQAVNSVAPSQRAKTQREEMAALQKIRTGQTKGPGMACVRTSMDVDPILAIKQVRVPILVLQGGADVQVLPQDLPRLVNAAKSANSDVTVRVFAADNHLFMKVKTGEPQTPQTALQQYLTVPSSIDPAMVDALVAWLNSHARAVSSAVRRT